MIMLRTYHMMRSIFQKRKLLAQQEQNKESKNGPRLLQDQLSYSAMVRASGRQTNPKHPQHVGTQLGSRRWMHVFENVFSSSRITCFPVCCLAFIIHVPPCCRLYHPREPPLGQAKHNEFSTFYFLATVGTLCRSQLVPVVRAKVHSNIDYTIKRFGLVKFFFGLPACKS